MINFNSHLKKNADISSTAFVDFIVCAKKKSLPRLNVQLLGLLDIASSWNSVSEF